MDPIADMFSQIKNAQNARKEVLIIPYSKFKMAILEILKGRRQITDFKFLEKPSGGNSKTKSKKIEIKLFKENSLDIRKVSRSGRRVYTSSLQIPRPKNPRALYIISTSMGVLEGEEARKKGLGGEVIAEIR